MNKKQKKTLGAIAVLMSGVVISWFIATSKPTPAPDQHISAPPHNAEVLTADLRSREIIVASQGTVTPKTQIDIISRVSGEVVSVGKNFAAGGYFSKDEILLTLDPRDYEIATIIAESNLADAQKTLAQEQGLALQVNREWHDLGDKTANDLFLRKPQMNAAEAGVKAAEATLRQTQIDLERATVSLPFDGRVVKINANLGQYINSGTVIGSVYASDTMEVRLPLTAAELKLLNLHSVEQPHALSPLNVELSFAAGSDTLHWQGRIVRIEASVDAKSRLFYLIAEIDNRITEYTTTGKPVGQIPVLPGTFLQARITSNPHQEVATLPRSALYQNDQVMVLDSDSRLRLQKITVLQMDADTLIIRGLIDGQPVLAKPPSFMDIGAVYTPIDFKQDENKP